MKILLKNIKPNKIIKNIFAFILYLFFIFVLNQILLIDILKNQEINTKLIDNIEDNIKPIDNIEDDIKKNINNNIKDYEDINSKLIKQQLFYKNELFWIIVSSIILVTFYHYYIDLPIDSFQFNNIHKNCITYQDYIDKCDEVVNLKKELWFESIKKEKLLENISKKEKLLKLYGEFMEIYEKKN
jgi:hypothetical protein